MQIWKRECLHFLLWLAELLNSETTDATTMLQTLPTGSQIELQMCMLPGGLRVVFGISEKDSHFLWVLFFVLFCFEIAGIDVSRGGKKEEKQNLLLETFFNRVSPNPQTLKHRGFRKSLSFRAPPPALLMSTETPICIAQYLIQSLGLSL